MRPLFEPAAVRKLLPPCGLQTYWLRSLTASAASLFIPPTHYHCGCRWGHYNEICAPHSIMTRTRLLSLATKRQQTHRHATPLGAPRVVVLQAHVQAWSQAGSSLVRPSSGECGLRSGRRCNALCRRCSQFRFLFSSPLRPRLCSVLPRRLQRADSSRSSRLPSRRLDSQQKQHVGRAPSGTRAGHLIRVRSNAYHGATVAAAAAASSVAAAIAAAAATSIAAATATSVAAAIAAATLTAAAAVAASCV